LSDLKQLKRRLRVQLRTERDALSAAERTACEDRALKHLADWEPWQRARTVASYLPHESEFDPTPLMSVATQQGKRVACPRVVDQSLQFHRWEQGDPTEPTTGGVLQPLGSADRVLTQDIDIFITPLLGCGKSGMRLGYGGGFYDRLFARVSGFRLGVGFAVQSVDDWEAEAHDQRLDGFLSDAGLTLFS
jgi:5-formyltetrahydrofolate cyclo-ligase